ncbi:hypothetical protein BU24DRAFT_225775 [Aaosphaeria arxii CBS 175.79]|uniref:Uncharacterized protein n=1 Tax=Aaosphaeria arxii CBS 175.79 TaxID=1450172 RepID=A0A6A5XNY6_9PLEO|nr:uncharacterized protein BU24DRAFT_225775 [Aaosphaeria arxii CBS 175.79]KAF2014958.1 hypothetical protein BU24DRAFT_225775 [Aaosphaeria arxii CBS 175.79]
MILQRQRSVHGLVGLALHPTCHCVALHCTARHCIVSYCTVDGRCSRHGDGGVLFYSAYGSTHDDIPTYTSLPCTPAQRISV